jgi:hypothetical protein
MIQTRKEFGAKKEFKEKIGKITKDRWADPEYKKQLAEKRKKIWANPEYKKRIAEIKKQKLQTPIKCEICKKEFIRNVVNQKVCSKECKNKKKRIKVSIV